MISEAPASMLAATDTIRHASVDGFRVILDLRSGQYRVLDHVGSVLWSVLTGEAEKTVSLDALASQYDVDLRRLEGDLNTFGEQCIQQRLLEASRSAGSRKVLTAGRVTPGKPTVPRALRSILSTDFALWRKKGFEATYHRYALLSASGSGQLQEAMTAFRHAENFYLARRTPDDCLVRSLSLYRFLCEVGVEAEHVIGVRRIPFQAHAWVECEGAPLLDNRGVASFTRIARLRPAEGSDGIQ